MNQIFDWIDKYKFGLIAVVAAYVFTFSSMQFASIPQYTPIEPFHMGPVLEPEEPEIKLEKEQIEVPTNFSSDVKNMARDRNDQREKSMTDYSQNTPSQGSQSVKDLEKKYLEEAGGDAKRAAILKAHEEKKEKLKQKNNADKPTENKGSGGGEKAYAGNVMVDFDLGGRDAHQGNRWYVRNPGYTCGKGSGLVVVDISVNQSRNVVSAKYNAAASNGASPCMIEQATKYAGMSRFAFDDTAPKTQQGKIYYTFVSQ